MIILKNNIKNIYNGKSFSVLGDSISALQGYIPSENNVFYDAEKCSKAGISSHRDMWWGRVIDYFEGKLVVNNSWSGSMVAKMPDREELYYSGCSDERAGGLHKENEMPDIIIVFLGANDWCQGVSPYFNGDIQRLLDQSFSYAYNNMLKKIRKNYPLSEIWCCTLCVPDTENFNFAPMGVHIKEYCDIIKDVAVKNSAKVIDFYSGSVRYDTIDGFHPSAKGMKFLADVLIEEVS